jgi:hypothetical protein
MKTKKFIIAFLILMLGATFANAQSTLEKKLRADLEKSKKHRETMLLKAQEQQRQRQDEIKAGTNIGSLQQNNNVNQNASLRQQVNQNNSIVNKNTDTINNSAKKEDINQ